MEQYRDCLSDLRRASGPVIFGDHVEPVIAKPPGRSAGRDLGQAEQRVIGEAGCTRRGQPVLAVIGVRGGAGAG